MSELEHADELHVQAAQGWLELGNLEAARLELEQVSQDHKQHPTVLQTRYNIFFAEGDFESAATIARTLCEVRPNIPAGWVGLASALHKLKRTGEARAVLRPLAAKFPRDHEIAFDLACYSCHLGNVDEGRDWFERAFEYGDMIEIKERAMENPDLEPLWPEIADL